ncbi:hypothetical protein [Halobacterium rubrum]|uniref:hypothetical protein n=1 Tax=Halobacterium TaxID=2239 RepID=UPI001F41511E|nr:MULTISPECIES: hypothetical protein [Halobacterium]MDH5018645.1 hypothetical protein [Halobacterium rubrum]
MPTRRALLRDGAGAASLAVLAGCQSALPSSRNTTTQPESSGAGEPRLDAEPVTPSSIPDGATVGVTSPPLHELVANAAEADGRVDLQTTGSADGDESLTLGGFDYVEFEDQTYESTASFAGFGEESTAKFSLLAVDGDEVGADADVTTYESLSDREQAVADEMLADGSLSVGRHERRPEEVGAIVGSEFFRADGQTYRIQITVGDPPAHHMLELDTANPGDDAQVVTVLDERPAADWSDVLQEGLGPGSVGVEDLPSSAALVDYLDGIDYVVTATTVADATVNETVQ